jgi:ABC-2 type transport system permease protein
MRLVGVEVRRVLARRLVSIVALVGVLVIGMIMAGTWFAAQPLSAEQLANAETEYERYLADWEANHEQWHADCVESEEREAELTGEQVDFGCDWALERPEQEMFLPQSPELAESFEMLMSSAALLPLILVLLVGITSTAAEVSSGSLSTWLTFVPRRMRVMASKLTAALVVVVPVVAGLTALLVGGFYAVHAAHDVVGDMTGEVWAGVAWLSLRLVVLGGVVAMVGAALGLLLKQTGIALGAVIGWTVIVEQILAAVLPRLQPYLLTTNINAWVQNGTTYWLQTCEVTSGGTVCEYGEQTLGLAQSSVYLAVGSVVVVALTALVFRRRDVA